MNPTTSSGAAQAAGGFVTNVLNWAAQPFKSQGSALNWVLFVGLLMLAAWGWNHILMTINNDI